MCRDCGIGNYQTEDASTSCQLCPSRHTTISNVSRSIDDCLGKYSSYSLSPAVTGCSSLFPAHCQPNTFNSTHGVEPCLPCPDRYYQLTYGSTGCIPCPERSEIPQCILPSREFELCQQQLTMLYVFSIQPLADQQQMLLQTLQ